MSDLAIINYPTLKSLCDDAYQRGVAAERERCALEAADWFTLSPSFRTKERLLAAIRKGE